MPSVLLTRPLQRTGEDNTFSELLKSERIDVVHIPYRGTAPSLTDVIAGQVAATMTGVAPVLPFVRSGQLRALGVSGRERSPALPDVPTIAEQGVKDFEATQWYGLVAPAGTPAAIVERLNSELRKILASSETSELFASLGAVPSPSSPEEFRKHIAREIGRWERVVRGAHIEAE